MSGWNYWDDYAERNYEVSDRDRTGACGFCGVTIKIDRDHSILFCHSCWSIVIRVWFTIDQIRGLSKQWTRRYGSPDCQAVMLALMEVRRADLV